MISWIGMIGFVRTAHSICPRHSFFFFLSFSCILGALSFYKESQMALCTGLIYRDFEGFELLVLFSYWCVFSIYEGGQTRHPTTTTIIFAYQERQVGVGCKRTTNNMVLGTTI